MRIDALANDLIDPLFVATVEAVEEAVIDSMIVNQTMVGRDGNTAVALPHAALVDLMRRYGRVTP